jgi:acyl carrier protein
VSLESQLAEIFSIALDLNPDEDPTKIRKIAHRSWDSLATTSIIAGIESVFDLIIDNQDIERITSYDSTLYLIKDKRDG